MLPLPPRLAASAGNPGLALTWARGGRLAMRDEVAAHLRALQEGKANAVEIANAWAKAEPDARPPVRRNARAGRSQRTGAGVNAGRSP